MNRADLEAMDRNALITQAEALGVSRANILTRPELMDELLVRTARKDDKDLPRSRGFFGRARDLVARVIEKGLHLPDAAERLRQVSVAASQIAARVVPSSVPTVTLAEIYAAQGHRARAVETLRRVLEHEPDHAAAQSLLTKLQAAPPTMPPPSVAEPTAAPEVPATETVAASPVVELPVSPASSSSTLDAVQAVEVSLAPAPEGHGEPLGFLDDEPLPARYDVDECVAIAVDPVTLYVYWEVRAATFEHLRRKRGNDEGVLTLRLLIITPSWDGPRSSTRDFDVHDGLSDRVVRDLPAGAVVRAAIGWRAGEVFLPIAHAPALETPPGAPCPVLAESLVRWTPHGIAPVTGEDIDFASIGRALGRWNPRIQSAALYGRSSASIGSSDVSAGFSPVKAPGRFENAPSSQAGASEVRV